MPLEGSLTRGYVIKCAVSLLVVQWYFIWTLFILQIILSLFVFSAEIQNSKHVAVSGAEISVAAHPLLFTIFANYVFWNKKKNNKTLS